MARFINPAPQYKPYSKLYFFNSNTNTQLATYADSAETIPNAHPVLCDADGRAPNIFFSVISKLVVLDENNVQYIERDPVGGGSSSGGGLGDWSEAITYGVSDLAKGSNNKIYASITAGNVSNDPTITPTEWEEVRFVGVWNTNVTYSIGEVVQTSNGNLWKSLTATAGNNPEIDVGTNWVVAIDDSQINDNTSNISDNTADITALQSLLVWKNESSDFTAAVDEAYQIDGSTSAVDASLTATLTPGNSFVFHNESISTNTVRVLNPLYDIKGAGGVLSAGDNLILNPGDTAHLVARSTTILEVV